MDASLCKDTMHMAHKIRTVNTTKHSPSIIPVHLTSIVDQFKLNFNQRKRSISDPSKQKWVNHKGVQKLEEVLNLKETCGYVTFIKTGVRDIGCENYDINVHLVKSKRSAGAKEQQRNIIQKQQPSTLNYIVSPN